MAKPSASKATDSLTEQAYSKLEERIVTLKLKPGTAVSENQLAAELGLGRTPVREALQRLAREHLVQILPRRGIIVSQIDVKAQLRLLELRRELERFVARCAARRATADERASFQTVADVFAACARSEQDDRAFMRADKQFNSLLVTCARNEFADAAMTQVQALSRRFWYLHYRQAADMPETARRHADVAQAVADGDADAAAAASDRLVDLMAEFTRQTVSTDF